MDLKRFRGEPQIILSSALIEHVDYLHKAVGSTEWSGVLLWKIVEGDISDPDNLVIECVDLFLMDIGTSTYTEFESDAENIIALANQFPEYEDGEIFTGLIHTHHNMTTTFSGTDDSELKDNTEAYAAYLSLIVNFDMKCSARLAFKVENTVQKKYSIKNLLGDMFDLQESGKSEMIAYYQCDVQEEDYEKSWFKTRLNKIKAEKEAKKPVGTMGFNTGQAQHDFWGRDYRNGGYGNSYGNSYQNQQMALAQSQSAVSKDVNIKSFICKAISLNPNYLGGDIKHAVATMNSRVYNDKNKEGESILSEKYRSKLEKNIDDALSKAFNKNMSIEDILSAYEQSIERLQDFQQYKVAEIMLETLTDTLMIYEEEEE